MILKKRNAFTCLDLLRIILIFSILAYIIWPQYKGNMTKKRREAAWPTLQILDQAVAEFCSKNPKGTASNSTIAVKIPADQYWTYKVNAKCSDLANNPNMPAIFAYGKESMKLPNGFIPYLSIRDGGGMSGSYMPE